VTMRWFSGEVLLDEWRAALLRRSTMLARASGALLLTNYRLAFEARATYARHSHWVLLRELARAQAVGRSPRMQIVAMSGDAWFYGILASQHAAVWSAKSAPTRDHAVSRIDAAITLARRYGWVPPT
jgi:hypothetical protein